MFVKHVSSGGPTLKKTIEAKQLILFDYWIWIYLISHTYRKTFHVNFRYVCSITWKRHKCQRVARRKKPFLRFTTLVRPLRCNYYGQTMLNVHLLFGSHNAWAPVSSVWQSLLRFPSVRGQDVSLGSSPLQDTSDVIKGMSSSLTSSITNSATAPLKPSWRQMTLTSSNSHFLRQIFPHFPW